MEVKPVGLCAYCGALMPCATHQLVIYELMMFAAPANHAIDALRYALQPPPSRIDQLLAEAVADVRKNRERWERK